MLKRLSAIRIAMNQPLIADSESTLFFLSSQISYILNNYFYRVVEIPTIQLL